MAPPFDLHALGYGGPDDSISDDFYYNIFADLPTAAPGVAIDSDYRDLLLDESAASDETAGLRYCEASIGAEIDRHISRCSPDFFPLFKREDAADDVPLDNLDELGVFTEPFPATEAPESFITAASACLVPKRGRKVASKRRAKRKRSPEFRKKTAEIRVSTKIPRDGTYLKEKAWLGTFATAEQADRARDVGTFFLCKKNKKKFFDPRSEEILSTYNECLRELPLAVFMERVTKVAKHYGEHGKLPESLDGL